MRPPPPKCWAPPLVIPAHVDGWTHFSEGSAEFVAAFDEAGISALLGIADHGQWIEWPRAHD